MKKLTPLSLEMYQEGNSFQNLIKTGAVSEIKDEYSDTLLDIFLEKDQRVTFSSKDNKAYILEKVKLENGDIDLSYNKECIRISAKSEK